MEKENIFTGKTVDEAIINGLSAMGVTLDEVDVTVVSEAKKGFLGIGSKDAEVKIALKATDGTRAIKFIEGLMDVLNIEATSELLVDDERIEIEIKAENTNVIIGRRGEILDAIQCIAGAVANIGREDYKKVVVDCENYREQREKTLINLAHKLEKKAVEKGRKVKLEPMNPYERRIIHAALSESTEVKTLSDGKEPNRFVVIVPNNLKPFVKSDKKPRGDRKDFRGGDRRGPKKDFRGGRQGGGNRQGGKPASRGKKQMNFGNYVYLGNSGNKGESTATETKTEE